MQFCNDLLLAALLFIKARSHFDFIQPDDDVMHCGVVPYSLFDEISVHSNPLQPEIKQELIILSKFLPDEAHIRVLGLLSVIGIARAASVSLQFYESAA